MFVIPTLEIANGGAGVGLGMGAVHVSVIPTWDELPHAALIAAGQVTLT
jgi:hypothetical protein